MLTLVIVEDNAALRDSLVDVLSAENLTVTAYESAEALLAQCDIAAVDILLLDLNLPGEDGVSLARRLRQDWPGLGIIMLTARGAPRDRSAGYESGADIYLTKPSSAPELTASIRALARRLNKDNATPPPAVRLTAPPPAPPPLPHPVPLLLRRQSLTLIGPLGTQSLSAIETDLLEAFSTARDNRLDLETILRVGQITPPVSKATLGVKIVRLRKKLVAAGAVGQPLHVVRKWGYQLSVPITVT